jgi:threonine aldolase
MKIIDLRSDTVTLPTAEMRKAMFEAEVGDDVFREDPSINRLEAMSAERMGKEAALSTTSGTQSNLIAVLAHTCRGNEIILGSKSHIFLNEVGGAAAVGGVVMRTVPNDELGRLASNDVEQSIRSNNIHYPETALLCLENTHNYCGGAVLSADYMDEISVLAHARGVKVHLDGARIFNASVALGVPALELTRKVDSVSFCISKGLSAPVGSLLCGSIDFIERSRKIRKMLGGGMRQAGIIASAGIVALNTMVERLAEDHANARRLARGLAKIKGIILEQPDTPTNIVFFSLSRDIAVSQFNQGLEKAGVKISHRGDNLYRAVTHYGVSSLDIDKALTHIKRLCQKLYLSAGK